MNRPLVISREAVEDLDDAEEWFESQRSGLGQEFLVEVESALNRLGVAPEAHAIIFDPLRRALVDRFSYGIFYRVDDEQITVVAVYNLRRDPKGWQDRA